VDTVRGSICQAASRRRIAPAPRGEGRGTRCKSLVTECGQQCGQPAQTTSKTAYATRCIFQIGEGNRGSHVQPQGHSRSAGRVWAVVWAAGGQTIFPVDTHTYTMGREPQPEAQTKSATFTPCRCIYIGARCIAYRDKYIYLQTLKVLVWVWAAEVFSPVVSDTYHLPRLWPDYLPRLPQNG
jgi:hypothetical protein